MRPYWITFGQIHTHRVHGNTLDCDCVAEILAENETQARRRAFELFGAKYAFVKAFEPDMSYFPQGIIKLDE